MFETMRVDVSEVNCLDFSEAARLDLPVANKTVISRQPCGSPQFGEIKRGMIR